MTSHMADEIYFVKAIALQMQWCHIQSSKRETATMIRVQFVRTAASTAIRAAWVARAVAKAANNPVAIAAADAAIIAAWKMVARR